MSALSDYLENKLLEHSLRGAVAPYTPPTTVYVALFTGATNDNGMVTGGAEVAGGSYQRQAVTFGPAVSGSASNTSVVSFVGMPAATVTHCAITDALSGGNFLYHGPLGTPRTVDASDTLSFAIGALTCTLA